MTTISKGWPFDFEKIYVDNNSKRDDYKLHAVDHMFSFVTRNANYF